MRNKTLVVLIAVSVMVVSSAAMAKGGGGAGGKGGSAVGHGHFFGRPHSFNHRLRRNQFLLGDWGWGWGLGGYGDNGYSNTNVVIYPQATPQFATGAVAATPCHWNEETFKVPSLIGGTQPVSVVSCR